MNLKIIVGGIYTVLKTKAAVTTETYGSNYCLLGPLWGSNSELEVEETFDPQFLDCICTSEAIKNMREDGVGILCGRWLVPGSPSVILFDLGSVRSKLDTWRVDLYKEAGISAPEEDSEMNNVILFGYLITWFIGEWLQASRRHEQTGELKNFLSSNLFPRTIRYLYILQNLKIKFI